MSRSQYLQSLRQQGYPILFIATGEEAPTLSLKDPLTGIHNRRYFDLFLSDEVNRHLRLGHEVAIVMLDIDHFKNYNDTFGHPAGDRLLQKANE